jgi:hypothetical protein
MSREISRDERGHFTPSLANRSIVLANGSRSAFGLEHVLDFLNRNLWG